MACPKKIHRKKINWTAMSSIIMQVEIKTKRFYRSCLVEENIVIRAIEIFDFLLVSNSMFEDWVFIAESKVKLKGGALLPAKGFPVVVLV